MLGAPNILVAGAGYVGLYAALRLQSRLRRGEATITVVNPENFMLNAPLLPEVASGMLEPRQVVVPLRNALRGCRILTGQLRGVDTGRRSATVETAAGDCVELGYDHLVVALGSVTAVLPVPGLEEHAVGFRTLAEALYLHDEVLAQFERAASTTDPAARARALTFVFVGGGYAGVEALAELQHMAAATSAWFPTIRPEDQRWVVVDAADRILAAADPRLADYAEWVLRRRGIEVRAGTRVERIEAGRMKLSDGDELDAGLIVWTIGARPHPLLAEMGLPVDEGGRVRAQPTLAVDGVPNAWTGGDCAAVPDIGTGGLCPPTAQYAVRQGRHLADNIVATLRGEPVRPFAYRNRGEFLTLGRYQGAARVLDRTMHGLVPWLLRRLYYVTTVPGLDRKSRLLADWTASLAFPRDVVSFGSTREPGTPLAEALELAGRRG